MTQTQFENKYKAVSGNCNCNCERDGFDLYVWMLLYHNPNRSTEIAIDYLHTEDIDKSSSTFDACQREIWS